MDVVVGCLLGLAVIAALLGLHAGPHVHLASAVLGLIAAGVLVEIAATGNSWPGLWFLFSADVVVSGGVAALAWKALSNRQHAVVPHRPHGLDGAEGIAVTDLTPAGIVRVRGEQWSATSANGPARSGTRVQVLGIEGVRLDVWAEEPQDALPGTDISERQTP